MYLSGVTAIDIVQESVADAKVAIEPNVVRGSGIPGSVDKGKLEQRGERVVVTTAHPTSRTGFEWTLRF